jgi:hypothetical protein
MHNRNIGRKASLTSSSSFSPKDTFSGKTNIGFVRDNSRISATEFQCDGGDVVGGCFHNFLADFEAASEQDVAESVFEEGLGGFAAADDAAVAAGVEVFGEEFYEEVGCGGCEFTVDPSVSGKETLQNRVSG